MRTRQFFIATAMICIAFLFSINLAYSYPWISPYAYCANNPIRYVDLNGDSISLADIQRLDQAINTNYTQTIVNDVQSQTGLTITVSANGTMTYAKDADSNPVIATTTDANGNTIQMEIRFK
jgi:hypothetical protein